MMEAAMLVFWGFFCYQQQICTFFLGWLMKAHCSSISAFEIDLYGRLILLPPSLQMISLLSEMFFDFIQADTKKL